MIQRLQIQNKREGNKIMDQMAVIKKPGMLEGVVVEIIPESYLQEDWEWVEHPKTKIQFPVKKEDLTAL